MTNVEGMTKLEGLKTGRALRTLSFGLRASFVFVIRASPFSHSYRSAVTGSKRDAVQAGAKPEMSPVMTETIMLAMTSPTEN